MVTYLRFFILSFALHIVLLCALVTFKSRISVSQKGIQIVSAYLFQAPQSSRLVINKPKKTVEQFVKKHEIVKHKGGLYHKVNLVKQQFYKTHSVTESTTLKSPKPLTVGVYNRLLSEIHDVVLKNLIYPQQALFLNVSGTVILGFELLPSGEIRKIYIVKTSGYSFLDKAAKVTLEKISPLLFAQHYLKYPEKFTLPITFEVTS